MNDKIDILKTKSTIVRNLIDILSMIGISGILSVVLEVLSPFGIKVIKTSDVPDQNILDSLNQYQLTGNLLSFISPLLILGTATYILIDRNNKKALKQNYEGEQIIDENYVTDIVPKEPKIIEQPIIAELIFQESEICKKLACFETFANYAETFEYFGNRMEGTNSKKLADRIDVTYFVDDKEMSAAEKAAEENYFSKQVYCIIHKNLTVRRILLIKSKSDYKKMTEQLDRLRRSPRFDLGVYVLSDDNDKNLEGNFRNHFNFNFMVIDSKEFCFNNGNRQDNQVDISIHMSSIMHEELAKEMKKHIDYLWKHSLKVKSMKDDDMNQEKFLEIERRCKENKYCE